MNSKGHLAYSLVKSMVRIAGCIFLLLYYFSDHLNYGIVTLTSCFIIAEVLGILEELVDER